MSVINKDACIDFYSQEYVVFYAEQYDDGTRSLTITPKDGAKTIAFNADEWDAHIIYNKPDGKVCFNPIIIKNNSTFYVEFTEQMLAVAGNASAQFYLVNKATGDILQSTTFTVVIEEALARDDIESADEFSTLNTLMERISTMDIDSIADKLEDINNAYETAVEAAQQATTALETANQAVEVAENINSTASQSAEDAANSSEEASEYAASAKTSSENAATSETNAKTSETNAQTSETNAKTYETNAQTSEINAKASEEAAVTSATNAKTSETNAASSATSASESATSAGEASQIAQEKAEEATDYANTSKSYAVGGTGTRDGEDTDNAKYYYEQVKAVSVVGIATTDTAGIVKPDGTTITIDVDGTIHSIGGTSGGITEDDLNEALASHKHSGIKSEDGTYETVMQDDGNLVTYNHSDGTAVFDSFSTAKTEDLANYLPKTGGELSGDLKLVSSDATKKSISAKELAKSYQFCYLYRWYFPSRRCNK